MKHAVLILFCIVAITLAACSSCPQAERERDHAWESWEYDHKKVLDNDTFEARQAELQAAIDEAGPLEATAALANLDAFRATHMPDALYQTRLFARDEHQKRSGGAD